MVPWTLFIPVFILSLVAFLATYLAMPWLIKALTRSEITESDLHKRGNPEVPTMGGIGVFVGFATAMTLSAILQVDYRLMFAIFLSGTLAVLGGLVDDLFRFSKKTLVALTFLISSPVIAFRAGSTLVYLTPFGPADFGWFFWILVPFAFAFLMNGVNIYAGFNGLEAGLGVVSSIALGVCALLYGSLESAAALFALAGALVGFLKWNWFPAKVFPGNSGTLLIGAVLASSIITGTIKIVGVIVCLPYFVNFVLRARDRFNSTVADAKPMSKGTLKSERVTALWALFTSRNPTMEEGVAVRCILIQVLFGVTAVAFAIYHIRLLGHLAGS